MNYLLQYPKRNNGIYMIINIEEKKVYVGLAQNMLVRTQEHFKAICNESEDGENKYLVSEKNKNYLHIAIYQENQEIDRTDLENLESFYIYLMKTEYNFGLYNDKKKEITKKQVEKKYLDDKENLKNKLEEAFWVSCKQNLTEIGKMNREERKSIWKEIVEIFCKSTKRVKKFCLEKGDNEKYCEADSEKYTNLLRSMDRFYISNRLLKRLDINWKHKSIIEELEKGEESEIFYKNEIILSNFGAHNGEIPYEILKKMDMDLKNSSNGCAYWALKNVNEKNFINRYSDLVGKQPYVLFKTTTSDNSGGENMSSLIDSSMYENEINRIDKEKQQKNMPDLMHSYKNENGKWVALPNNLTYITIPVNSTLEGMGHKAVAFVIEKFYICQENFE